MFQTFFFIHGWAWGRFALRIMSWADLEICWLNGIELKMATLGLATLKAKRRTANRSKKRARPQPVNMDALSPSSPLRPSNVVHFWLVSTSDTEGAWGRRRVRSPRLARLTQQLPEFFDLYSRKSPNDWRVLWHVTCERNSSAYASGNDHSIA